MGARRPWSPARGAAPARRRLERAYPGAAGSLREGMEETLTLTRLGVSGNLKRTLETTNPCESMIEIVRRTQRNVKRWSSGEMALRWTAAGMLEAERQFRKIIGYRDLATLVVAIERDHDARRHPSTPRTPRPRRPLSSQRCNDHTGTAAENPRRAGHPLALCGKSDMSGGSGSLSACRASNEWTTGHQALTVGADQCLGEHDRELERRCTPRYLRGARASGRAEARRTRSTG